MRAGHKQSSKAPKKKKTLKLDFRLFPRYADFILKHRLRDFISFQIRLMMDMDFPMLRFADVAALTEDQIIDMSMPSHTEFLNNAINNTLHEYLLHTINKWKSDQLPNVGREQLMAEDITMSVYIRKRALVKFIPEYLDDLNDALELVKEIEDYSLQAETLSFNTFIDVQNHKVKKMNRELEKSRNQLLEAQELANLGSFDWDMTGRGRSTFTPQVQQIFGLSDPAQLSELLGNVHPQDREKLKHAIEGALKGRREYECEYRYRLNGKEKLLWSRAVVEMRENQPYRLRGTVMDITARQSMLRKLQKNEELYKQAEKLANLGNWTYDPKSREISWSDEMYRIFNLSPQSKEITFQYFIDLVHPDDREAVRKQLRTILIDRQMDYRLRVVLPGRIVKHLRGRGEILRDKNNRSFKIVGTCQDITREVAMTEELKLREENLAHLNASLEQKNVELERKNEELTSFNYVASHDLQEPLRKIKTFSDLALTREGTNLSEAGRGWLERIGAAAGRMQKLIQDLLAFSRTQLFDDSRRPVDLNEVLAGIKTTYENELAQDQLEIRSGVLPVVEGVPFQIQQLLENLISNSVKYREEDNKVIVKISCEEAEVVGTPNRPEQNYIKISFADNGIGFEQKYASKIFEIFQRLHGQLSYSGTGIGLAICKKIVENHNGIIRASGTPGEGAVFDVYFPKSIVIKPGDC